MSEDVKAWAELVQIPTYKIGTPEKNPMFLEKRVYQGSSGVVYPHPVIDKVFDEKEAKDYTALFLENRYLKIMILPELGGRVQMALDKTNGYHFVYYNRVIKPALVGLAGPWISGGIEFNWPQHHRPSTFDPLDWSIRENADGSKTVWCAEIEQMFHTKGMHGFTLYPEHAYLEIRVQLYNRTSEPQTFLWWANPAVHVHDEYQSVFPPDVHAVMDHGKRDVSTFPIATGTYYKVNYAPGTDISRYKNIPVPTSYMAYHSDFDFMGDYDHRAEAGMLHIANHHIVPGKKQWTWGHGEFGQAWDRQLTDEDGPYIELMCGAYTDNQPDFSWIQPGEEKAFTQIFMPYKKIGPACNANEHAALNLEVLDGRAKFGIYLTSPDTITVRLSDRDRILYEKKVALDPEDVLIDSVPLLKDTKAQDLKLRISKDNSILLEFTPLSDEKPATPAPASPARPASEIDSQEELFLNGLHLEQYRHATFSPELYYLEALRRDPGDSRCNNAMGLLLYRRGRFAEAESYFQRAIQRLTQRNPNPYDGESYYNLGLALKMQGRFSEAFNAFHKAVWNAAWQDAGYFELARLASRQGDIPHALDGLDRSLIRNGHHHKARHLKVALLRHAGEWDAARKEANLARSIDAMEYGACWERFLLDADSTFDQMVRPDSEIYLDLALDYAHAGLFEDAVKLLERSGSQSPMVRYTLGWVLSESGRIEAADEAFIRASSMPADYCFPNRLEDILILEAAMRANPDDPRAPYYLGNFWYAHRRYEEAITCWERARTRNPGFPTVFRNLGLAYFNKRQDSTKALECFETAFALDPGDARVFFELDQLYKKLNRPPAWRLELFEKYPYLVQRRDDLSVEYISLLNLTGRHEEAYRQLMQRNFHPWEGGEGKVTGQYVTSLVEMAKTALVNGHDQDAIDALEKAQVYPHNLGEGKLYGTQENNIFYYLGCAYELLGNQERALACFEQASTGLSEPTSAIYYNDQPPDMIFYQGLAKLKLDQPDAAHLIFTRLVSFGTTHSDEHVEMDYFAVSLPDFLVFDMNLMEHHQIHCLYMMGLGELGLGNVDAALAHFDAVLARDASHMGAMLHRRLI
jgi:tetratricopeptide (TPR) repeat protein